MFIVAMLRRALVASLLLAGTVHAQFRSPQVAVTGSTLQNLLNAQGQTINVATQQRAAQGYAALNVGIPVMVSFGVHPAGGTTDALSLYNLTDASPALYTVMPGAASPGWFTEVSYRMSPDRLVVNLFDPFSSIQGSTSFLGVNLFAQGFAIAGAPGTIYSEDDRNAGAQPRMLIFSGTGDHVMDAWLCAELDGDNDFDDAVYLLEFFAPVPTRQSTWGALKSRFR